MKEHNKDHSLFINCAIIEIFPVFIFVWFLALFFFFWQFFFIKNEKSKQVERKTKRNSVITLCCFKEDQCE